MENDAGIERPDTSALGPSENTGQHIDMPFAEVARIALPLRTRKLPAVRETPFLDGVVVEFSRHAPRKLRESENEDSCAAIALPAGRGLLLVADGLGGHRGGRRASQLLRSSLVTLGKNRPGEAGHSVVISGVVPVPMPMAEPPSDPDVRGAVLERIEKVNKRLLRGGLGSATTLSLAEVHRNRVRSYHAGDSELLVVTQRGKVKYSTVSHSPVGYAFESGLLTEEEALLHPDRHIVSNVVGSPLMSIEIGPWVSLTTQDTVLLATDGLFDNLMQSEIVDIIRKGPLAESVRELAEIAWQRMLSPMEDFPSKPDDLTILAYRRTGTKRTRRRQGPEKALPK